LLSDPKAHEVLYDEYLHLLERRKILREVYEPESNIGILPVNVDRLITMA